MGDSAAAYLRRSISYPSNGSRESPQFDPLRALTDSISFGRFMQESLAWEKWSTFSHNRRLEEVESLKKPGSVAQKKAYFEDYYKKRAAAKEAAVLEEATTTVDDMQAETANEIQRSCSTSHQTENVNRPVGINREQKTDASVVSVPYSVDASGVDYTSERKPPQNQCSSPDSSEMRQENTNHYVALGKKEEGHKPAADVTYSADVGRLDSSFERESPKTQQSCSTDLLKENVNNYVAVDKQEDRHTSAADANGVQSRFENKSLVTSTTEKEMRSVVEQNLTDDRNTGIQELEQLDNSIDQGKIVPIQEDKNPEEDIMASTSKKDQTQSTKSVPSLRASKIPPPPVKRVTFAKSKAESAAPVSSIKSRGENNAAPVMSIKSKGENNAAPVNKKRSTKSLHMSIAFTSSAGEMHKSTTSVFQPIENTKLHTTIRKTKDSSISLRNLTRASVSGILKQTLGIPTSEERRSKRLLNKSISGGLTENAKGQTLPADSNSSAANGSKTRSSFMFSPFKLRTEERAIKRKEFSQKLEEKTNTKGSEKMQLQTRSKVPVPPPKSTKLGRKLLAQSSR